MISLQRTLHLSNRLGRALRRELSRTGNFSAPDDEFLKWLRFINSGMLHQGNVAVFAHCIDHIESDAPFVEIGSFAGLSLNHIIYFLSKAKKTNLVFSVDKWHFEHADFSSNVFGSTIQFAAYRDHVVETFRKNVEFFSADRLPHHIQTDSDGFFAAWRSRQAKTDFFGRTVTLGGPIAFAYIDGDHTYKQTLKDFENADEFLVPGGFILFDDSEEGGLFGSTGAAKLAASKSNYRLVGRNPNYTIQKTK
jgi:hypothetical protein